MVIRTPASKQQFDSDDSDVDSIVSDFVFFTLSDHEDEDMAEAQCITAEEAAEARHVQQQLEMEANRHIRLNEKVSG